MRKMIRGALAVLVALVALSASGALACSVFGAVVCSGTTTGVEGITVTLTDGGGAFTGTTDSLGNFTAYVPYADTYSVTVDLGNGVVVALGTAICGPPEWTIALGSIEVDAPACAPPPPPTADCSPGFYKNHPDTWCGTDLCFSGETCDQLLGELSTRGTDSAAIREGAKAQLDACFGTAEASPCVDDDS